MGIVDIVILIIILFGAIGGFKAGVIKTLTDFVGTFIIIILAFYFKNYISVLLYENLPFFNFFGFIKGIEVFNILLYEILAFAIIFIALLFILKTILTITGLIEKILKATVILSIPSKILGIIVGAVESYVYVFLVLVIATLPIFDTDFIRESEVSNFMLNNTPILSPISEGMIDIYDDTYDVLLNRKDKSCEELNTEILKLLMDKEVVTKESAKKLVDQNKIHVSDESIVE